MAISSDSHASGQATQTRTDARGERDSRRFARTLKGSIRLQTATRVQFCGNPSLPAHVPPLVHPQPAAREEARRSARQSPHQTYRNSGRTLRATSEDGAGEVVEDGRQVESAPADDLETSEVGLPELVWRCCLVRKLRAMDGRVAARQPHEKWKEIIEY